MLVCVASYLLCNINFAVAFSHLFKKSDVRDYGSGNPGTTNMFRVYGLKMGLLTFIFDALKGVVCVLVSKWIFSAFAESDAVVTAGYFAGLFAVLGHVFPAFYGFRGGKGVATTVGVLFSVQPLFALCCVLPCLIVLFASDRMSVMSLLLSLFYVCWTWCVYGCGGNFAPIYRSVDLLCCVLITIMFAAIIFAHRGNIKKIFRGKEAPLGLRKALRGKSDTIVK